MSLHSVNCFISVQYNYNGFDVKVGEQFPDILSILPGNLMYNHTKLLRHMLVL